MTALEPWSRELVGNNVSERAYLAYSGMEDAFGVLLCEDHRDLKYLRNVLRRCQCTLIESWY